MLFNILYSIIIILIVTRFFYPSTIIINISVVALLSIIALVLLIEHAGVEVIVCSVMLLLVGVYRTKYYWSELSFEEDNLWSFPKLILVSSIVFGCLVILINDTSDLLNKVTITPFSELSIFSIFLITFLFAKLRER